MLKTYQNNYNQAKTNPIAKHITLNFQKIKDLGEKSLGRNQSREGDSFPKEEKR
jgi:hypothetical protein